MTTCSIDSSTALLPRPPTWAGRAYLKSAAHSVGTLRDRTQCRPNFTVALKKSCQGLLPTESCVPIINDVKRPDILRTPYI